MFAECLGGVLGPFELEKKIRAAGRGPLVPRPDCVCLLENRDEDAGGELDEQALQTVREHAPLLVLGSLVRRRNLRHHRLLLCLDAGPLKLVAISILERTQDVLLQGAVELSAHLVDSDEGTRGHEVLELLVFRLDGRKCLLLFALCEPHTDALHRNPPFPLEVLGEDRVDLVLRSLELVEIGLGLLKSLGRRRARRLPPGPLLGVLDGLGEQQDRLVCPPFGIHRLRHPLALDAGGLNPKRVPLLELVPLLVAPRERRLGHPHLPHIGRHLDEEVTGLAFQRNPSLDNLRLLRLLNELAPVHVPQRLLEHRLEGELELLKPQILV
mmetsp:Transcript_9659/g.23548  ORF Transcript_9659/g.23548 Transcript_9659/m.23548 type:complete len:326 (-) Transcript_9659:314-1291(-)